MHGFKILYEILKSTFEISHKIVNPYTAKYAFYSFVFLCVSYDIFELWGHKPWWDVPQDPSSYKSAMVQEWLGDVW